MIQLYSLQQNLIPAYKNIQQTPITTKDNLFIIGQILDAAVLAKEGDMYLLQSGSHKFYAKSTTTLPLGDTLRFAVTEQEQGIILLKVLENQVEFTLNNHLKIIKPLSLDSIQSGQVLEAQVLGKREDVYILLKDSNVLFLETKTPLEQGDSIRIALQYQANKQAFFQQVKTGMGHELFTCEQSPKELPVGQCFNAVVTHGQNGLYHLKIEEDIFIIKSANPLEVGQTLNVNVLKRDGNNLILQKEPEKMFITDKMNINNEFTPGQVNKFIIEARYGSFYLLKKEQDFILVSSDLPLEIGEEVELMVSGKSSLVLHQKIDLSFPETSKEDEQIKQLIKSFGVFKEKEFVELKESIGKIPVDQKTAIRYLLDTHLFTAILFPHTLEKRQYDRMEITQHKSDLDKQNIWEIFFDLEMGSLGHLEIKMKLYESNLFIQIWAESKDTESLLKDNYHIFTKEFPYVEIIPHYQGPLVLKNHLESLDLKV